MPTRDEVVPDAIHRPGGSNGLSGGDVECADCGAAFTTGEAFDADRPDGRFDVYGHPTEFVDADREAAGQWDASRWTDQP